MGCCVLQKEKNQFASAGHLLSVSCLVQRPQHSRCGSSLQTLIISLIYKAKLTCELKENWY